jgi:DNA-binding NarL/FixJ family response regulator
MKTYARRCLIADDHPAMAAAVGALLAQNGFEVVGPASDGVRAVALATETRPDVALIDYRMPRLGGVELVVRLREAVPETPLLVYTAEADEALVRDAVGAGAAGIVLKDAPLTDLLRALEVVASGRMYIDPALARAAMLSPSASKSALTAREVDVLRLLAEGLSHEEIGQRLAIGAETVRTHVRKATNRLGAATRTQAVATALRSGLIS